MLGAKLPDEVHRAMGYVEQIARCVDKPDEVIADMHHMAVE